MRKILFSVAVLLAAGCGNDLPDPGPASGPQVPVGFSLSGIGVGHVEASSEAARADAVASAETARTRADITPEALAAGSTVRVVAYRRSGSAADISADTYVCETTYVVAADGSLTPCTVGADGASTGSAGASAMRLLAGTYDFYACTPALPLAADHRTVGVPHGTDYACSCTPAQTVAPQTGSAPQQVALATLERRCSQLCFSVTRQAENVARVRIVSSELRRIAHSPAEAFVGSALPTGTNDGTYAFPANTFTQGAEPYQYSGLDEVLPKSSAVFDLKMQVVFNDAAEATDLQAEIPAMAFAPGLRYTFDLTLQGGFIVLTLQITPWNTDAVWDTLLGDAPYASVVVGTWEITGWSTDLGGVFIPSVDPNSWTANNNWSSDLGA